MLKIMTVGGCNVPGGVALVLCDESDVMLPGQSGGVLEQVERETTTFTVTFEVDGENIVLDGSRIKADD